MSCILRVTDKYICRLFVGCSYLFGLPAMAGEGAKSLAFFLLAFNLFLYGIVLAIAGWTIKTGIDETLQSGKNTIATSDPNRQTCTPHKSLEFRLILNPNVKPCLCYSFFISVCMPSSLLNLRLRLSVLIHKSSLAFLVYGSVEQIDPGSLLSNLLPHWELCYRILCHLLPGRRSRRCWRFYCRHLQRYSLE